VTVKRYAIGIKEGAGSFAYCRARLAELATGARLLLQKIALRREHAPAEPRQRSRLNPGSARDDTGQSVFKLPITGKDCEISSN
jgi:hypothetical protein